MKIDLKRNNLDWLRLVFALQVILIHGLENLKDNSTSLSSIVSWLLVERPMLKKKKVSLRASA